MILFVVVFSFAFLCCLIPICALIYVAIRHTEDDETKLICFAGVILVLLFVLGILQVAIDFIPQLYSL